MQSKSAKKGVASRCAHTAGATSLQGELKYINILSQPATSGELSNRCIHSRAQRLMHKEALFVAGKGWEKTSTYISEGLATHEGASRQRSMEKKSHHEISQTTNYGHLRNGLHSNRAPRAGIKKHWVNLVLLTPTSHAHMLLCFCPC